MRELSRKFMGAGASGVAFVVTAGGSMGNNSADIADARQEPRAAWAHLLLVEREPLRRSRRASPL